MASMRVLPDSPTTSARPKNVSAELAVPVTKSFSPASAARRGRSGGPSFFAQAASA